jgi:hypothetical protein
MSCLHYLQKKSLYFFPSYFFFFIFFELFLIFLYKQKTDTAEKNTQLDNKRGYKKNYQGDLYHYQLLRGRFNSGNMPGKTVSRIGGSS